MIETMILTGEDPVARFFAYARERQAIRLRREAGVARHLWTLDPILLGNRFTCVFREDDRVTRWFREHVREPLRGSPDILPATVVFRWFNRINTGEALFQQPDLSGVTAWDAFLATGDTAILRRAITAYCGKGPYVTGAYTINTISAGVGLSKLDGVLKLIEMWFEKHTDWQTYAMLMREAPHGSSSFGTIGPSLEEFCLWAKSPCLGDFMTYEIACDLRWTALLENAHDKMTWANLGPGARRGLNRIFRGLTGKAADKAIASDIALEEMRQLLAVSREPEHWPQWTGSVGTELGSHQFYRTRHDVFVGGTTPVDGQWPAWELREVEHTLCEFDKYNRIAAGEGRSRGSSPR